MVSYTDYAAMRGQEFVLASSTLALDAISGNVVLVALACPW